MFNYIIKLFIYHKYDDIDSSENIFIRDLGLRLSRLYQELC